MMEENAEKVAALFEGTVEPVVGGDNLKDLKPTKTLVPPSSKMLFMIQKAVTEIKAVQYNEEVSEENHILYRNLNLTLKLLEGILIPEMDDDGKPTGNMVEKFKGSFLFPIIRLWANPDIKNTPWFKNKQHLLDWKSLLIGLGEDILDSPEPDKEWCDSLQGKEIRANITVKFKQVMDKNPESETYNKWIDTSEQLNEVKGFSAA